MSSPMSHCRCQLSPRRCLPNEIHCHNPSCMRNNDTGNIKVNVKVNKIFAYPVVFVIVVVVGSPGDEDEDHGEDHEDDED